MKITAKQCRNTACQINCGNHTFMQSQWILRKITGMTSNYLNELSCKPEYASTSTCYCLLFIFFLWQQPHHNNIAKVEWNTFTVYIVPQIKFYYWNSMLSQSLLPEQSELILIYSSSIQLHRIQQLYSFFVSDCAVWCFMLYSIIC